MVLCLSLFFTPIAHAEPNHTVAKAIRAIEGKPDAFVMEPQPTEIVVDGNATPPVTKTVMVGGRGFGISNCPGYPNATVAFFSDPTNTVRTLSVMAVVNGQDQVLGDSDLDGIPETATVADREGNLTGKKPGAAELRAYTTVVLCASALDKK